MTTLKQLLKYKKFSFSEDWEWNIQVSMFNHKIILIPNNSDVERWISIDFDKTSAVTKEQAKLMFINFVKILKRYWIQYVFDENLTFNTSENE